ncbi:MAG TPA: lipid-binding SYLF domain-containing protein [Terriglobales bacterium]|nr:lipid-binding SYLF domain-containing protein [Terriglobales bacterium]HXZ81540.1 lipid-binding SYLF domain-containing protein [Terriglobales bacterium]
MVFSLFPRLATSIRTSALGFVVICIFACLAAPAWGASKEKDEETLKNAATVFQQVVTGDDVPADVLAKSLCIIVLPNVKKFGFGVGGSGGRGALSCRTGENFTGKWSAPAMYSIGGASVGAQVGGSSTDFVMLVMNNKGVEAVLKDKTKVGSDASATAGPSSASATSTSVGGSDLLTYAKSKGLFAGVSLDGATLHQDGDANQRLYGKVMSATDIVRGKDVKPPAGGQELVTLLDSKVPKLKH